MDIDRVDSEMPGYLFLDQDPEGPLYSVERIGEDEWILYEGCRSDASFTIEGITAGDGEAICRALKELSIGYPLNYEDYEATGLPSRFDLYRLRSSSLPGLPLGNFELLRPGMSTAFQASIRNNGNGTWTLHRCWEPDEWNEDIEDLVDCQDETAAAADIVDQLEAWLIAPEDCLAAIGNRDPVLAGIIREYLAGLTKEALVNRTYGFAVRGRE